MTCLGDGTRFRTRPDVVPELMDALHQIAVFRNLPEAVIARLAHAARVQRRSQGELVVLEGEPCLTVYGVVGGRLRVSRSAASGREQVLTELGPGEMVNVVPAFEAEPQNHASVRVLAPTTLVALESAAFLECVRASPELAWAILQSFAGRISQLVRLAADLSLLSVRGRLARFLLSHEGGQRQAARWTQEEIAAHLGTVRDVVGRALRAFADDGLVRIERQRILLLDRPGLEREAEQ